MVGFKAAVICILLVQLYAEAGAGSLSVAENAFEATALFEVSANSTCGGDPPTIFIYDDALFNCSLGDHSADFSFDSNPDTWWQSNNTDDPVSILFSLQVI